MLLSVAVRTQEYVVCPYAGWGEVGVYFQLHLSILVFCEWAVSSTLKKSFGHNDIYWP